MTRRLHEAHGFLRALFGGDDPSDGHVVLFSLPDHGVCAFPGEDLHAAARAAVRLSRTADVYFGCGLQGEVPARGRGRASGVSALPGFWGDIDLRAPYRQRADLPASVEVARTFLEELPCYPTAIVHSGGGLQGWWAFKEPWRFASDDERARAERLSRGWQAVVIGMARRRGWELDGTADLARVLRLPGTLNHKGTEPVPVRLLEAKGPRYVPSDFDDFEAEPPAPERPDATEPPVDAGTPRRRTYVSRAIELECLELANTGEGNRNNRLNEAAFSLARFVSTGEADPAKLADVLSYAARHAGLPEHEIQKTIQSAFGARGVPV